MQSKLKIPVFGNAREAYGTRSLFELLRSIVVLRVCRVKYMAQHSVEICKRLEKVVGPFLTYQVAVKPTIFKQFCAGEHQHELKKSIMDLDKAGIGSILDYAAEADEPEGEESMMRGMSAIAKDDKIKYVMPEQRFDEVMKLNLLCIAHASLSMGKSGVGFAAVKVSGLGEPLLLARVSALQLMLRQTWFTFFDEISNPPLEECRVVIGIKLDDRFAETKVVMAGIRRLATHRPLTPEEEAAIQAQLDPKGTGKVDYLAYAHATTAALLAPESTPSAVAMEPLLRNLPRLTAEELALWKRLEHRVDIICTMANILGVRVMFDAEQTYFQMAIDHVVRARQRQYNKQDPLIYNTYQCYLTFAYQRMLNDMARAESEGWVWAGKMVRGAYMDQERLIAKANSYKTPIWDTEADTHKCYNKCAEHILQQVENNPQIRYGVLFGTHNVDSAKLITNKMVNMKEHGSHIAFAQLFGMCDHLTVPLAKAGFVVFKYLPYGPVKETILYLGRRAKENSSVMGYRGEESKLMWEEARKKLFFSKK